MAIGLELQRRGHRAAIVTSEYHRQRITAAGLPFHPAVPDLRPDDKTLIRSTMDETRGPEAVARFMLGALRDTYADYERAVQAERADLLITSELAYAGVVLAQKLGLRWVSHVLSPVSFFSAYDDTVIPGAQWLSRLRPLGPRVYGAVLHLGKVMARRISGPINDLRRDVGLAPVRDPFLDDKHSPELVLAMFSPLLGSPQPDWPAQTIVTGFAFWDGDEPALSPELGAFLAAGDPPVVFTLGSAAVFDPGQFYVESARAARIAGRRAVLLVGPQPGALPRPDLRVGVFPYAPFSKLFPRAAAVVHQGGAGTTGQVMRSGRPMLVVPYAHDQPDNALRVRKLGIARTIRRGAYHAEIAGRALRELLVDAAIQRRAGEIGAVVAHERGAAVSADAIERMFSPRAAR